MAERTWREARADVERRLAAAGVPSPAADASLLLEEALGVDRATLLLEGDRLLGEEVAARLDALVARREAREPLQHVLGRAHFYGLSLRVDRRVLVPRPETERLVELVLEELRSAGGGGTVLDVGTGSGAIALALKAELPGAEVWGCDVSEDALAVARANAAALGLGARFVRSDLLSDDQATEVARRCSALVANLPYLPEEDAGTLAPEAAADPPLALFAADGGLALAARLVEQAWELLPGSALLALELDPRNVQRLRGRLGSWQGVRVEPDLLGRERFLLARR